ncbi:forkhead box protein P1-like isoform X2 [Tigriopus californicus]|uniref:forkhead box protein P1-like isoform X2 n=1 Tax=Tigriopus californicus TaxID=6832 RepID=UPI0027DAAA37|nr:forkhead box protein P1-like isoform X2 [Tigriopus californicus]
MWWRLIAIVECRNREIQFPILYKVSVTTHKLTSDHHHHHYHHKFIITMLGGATTMGLPNGKQFHRTSSPLDLETWRDTFLNANSAKTDDSTLDPMDGSSDLTGSGAINLTASSRPPSTPTAASQNGLDHDSLPGGPDDQGKHRGGHNEKVRRRTPSGDDHRVTCGGEENEVGSGKATPTPPPPLSSLFPPGLQQMQQLLQSQLASMGGCAGPPNGTFGPTQLQQFMQQQSLQHQQHMAEAGRKQLEQLMHQLQEQLQINLLQQTHMMQTTVDKGGKPSANALQQLQMQQQQLISQLQIVQQRMLMMPSFQHQKHKDADYGDRAWLKENGCSIRQTFGGSHASNQDSPSPKLSSSNKSIQGPKPEKENTPLTPPPLTPRRGLDANLDKHPLYSHGVCKWTGCETHCDDVTAFLKHISSEHVLDDKSTAQARVQMQIVSQLELQLQKERERLQAMMAHLHLTKEADLKSGKSLNNEEVRTSKSGDSMRTGSPLQSNERQKSASPPKLPKPPCPSLGLGAYGFPSPMTSLANNHMGIHPTPLSALTAAARNPTMPGLQPPMSTMGGPIRRRLSDKIHLPVPNGLPYMLDRTGLDIAQEIYRNREFYRTQDVRPPFTYASLIRQAITVSPTKQLTLSEIYNWFQSTFAHFRSNASTWKNAIRTNLSLHKCFVRYEDDFGSFWMVDDAEFMKRRHLSRGRPRKYEPGPTPPPNSASSAVASPASNTPLSKEGGLNTNATLEAGSGGQGGSSSAGGGGDRAAGGRFGLSNGPPSQTKSPAPFLPNPHLYNEALNASLQTALGFGPGDGPGAANLSFLNQTMASALHQQREREEKSQQSHLNNNNHALNERNMNMDYAKHLRNTTNFLNSLSERRLDRDSPDCRSVTDHDEVIKPDVGKPMNGTNPEDEDIAEHDQSSPGMLNNEDPMDSSMSTDYNGNNGNIKMEMSNGGKVHQQQMDKDIKREKFEN